jgi:hypothetical protein
MISTSTEPNTKALPSSTNGPDTVASPNAEGLTHRFQEGLGNHPLWQDYLAELEASRQADIAEANRLADLELEK